MGLFKFLQSTVAELLTIPSLDPYKEPYQPPRITDESTDANGRPVYKVYAQNHRDVSKPFEGTTYPGDVSRVCTHTGRNQWEVHYEAWDIPEEKKNT